MVSRRPARGYRISVASGGVLQNLLGNSKATSLDKAEVRRTAGEKYRRGLPSFATENDRLFRKVDAFIEQRQAHHNENRASAVDDKKIARKTFWVTVAGAAFALVAAFGAICSAHFAQQQVAGADDQGVKQLRAYPGVPGEMIVFQCAGCGFGKTGDENFDLYQRLGNINGAAFRVENFGATPAYSIHVCQKMFVTDGEDITAADYEGVEQTCTKATAPTVWPHERRAYGFPMNAGDMNQIRKGSRGTYIGYIEFLDSFGPERKSGFCFHLAVFENGPMKAAPITGCDDHNHPENN